MAVSLIRERSRITAKGQTTVPKVVRQALGVSYGGEIDYVIDERGRVGLVGAGSEEADPVIDRFLAFLAADMERNPRSIGIFPVDLAERIGSLTTGVNVDLDEEIDGPIVL